ncbi:MAG: hypothetical protein NVSMB65_17250 [Chloroflexota bacterium]
MMRDERPKAETLGEALAQAAPPPPPTLAASVMAAIYAEEQRAVPAALALSAPSPLQRARRRGGLWWRGALAALAVLVPVSIGVGAARAAEGSLPGEPLYLVRTMHESLLLSLAPDATARDTLVLSLAQQRIGDLDHAVEQHARPVVTHEVLVTLLAYNRRVSRAHAPWLRAALTRQYAAVRKESQRIAHDRAWEQAGDTQGTEQDLTTTLRQLRALARSVGAPWAQTGPDSPGNDPVPD